MKSRGAAQKRQKGFSLVELLTVVFILMLVTGVVFQQIDLVQKKSRQEDVKMDLTQEAREFLDQMVRDLHTSGYPNKRMYVVNVVNNNDIRNAVGLVQIAPSFLQFEGDVDGDGVVDSISYQLVSNGGMCPCRIQRSQVVKTNTEPWNQATNYNIEVTNVVNSGNVFPIAGTSTLASGTVSNDTLYGAYKAAPLFRAYDSAGIECGSLNAGCPALPLDLKTNPTTIISIRTIRITMTVLAGPEGTDFDTRMRPAVSMTAAARLNN